MAAPEEFDQEKFDKAYAARKALEVRLEGDTDGDLSLFRGRSTPEELTQQPEAANPPKLRLMEYDDHAGQSQAVFIALTGPQYSDFIDNPTAGLERFAGRIVYRAASGTVTPIDWQNARTAFRNQYPAATDKLE